MALVAHRVSAAFACVAFLIAITAASAAPDKLDRRQKEAVDRAGSHTTDVAKELTAIKESVDAIEKSQNPSAIPAKAISEFTDKIKLLRNRLSTAERAMKNIVDDHPDVKAMNALIAEQQAALTAASAAVDKLLATQKDARDPSKYPNIKQDIEKVQALAKAYAAFDLLDQPKRVADTLARMKEDIAGASALFKTYKPLIDQKTDDGKVFMARYTQLAENVKRFQSDAQTFVSAAPGVIETSLAGALKTAETATANKTPAFFDGGIAQEMEKARKHLAVFTAIAGPTHERSVALASKVDENEKKIAAMKESLKDLILAEMKTPADVYNEPDKARLKELVLSEWKSKYPADEILGVRFPVAQWKRKSGAQWNAGDKAWVFFDESNLTLRVAVKKDARLATLYYVTINKDHTSNDALKVYIHKGGTYVVEDMLLANYKP